MKQLFYDVLIEIISNPNISLTELELKLHLNRSQLEYQLTQINKFLEETNTTPLTRNHHYLSSDLTLNQLNHLVRQNEADQQPYFNKKERSILLPILLFTLKDTSLSALATCLNTSKNTIITDFSALKIAFSEQNLSFSNSRKTGYSFIGTELAIRTVVARSLMILVKHEFNLTSLLALLGITPSDYQMTQTKMAEFQGAIQSKFSDVYEQFLTLLIILCNRRSDALHSISPADNQELTDMIAEEDYCFTSAHLKETQLVLHYLDYPFIAVHVLSANIISSKHSGDSNLKKLIDDVITIFEKSMAITIEKHQQLNALLSQHIAPAIYRMKYGVPYEDSQLIDFSKDYQNIYQQVAVALKPIEQFYAIRFNYTETMYVVLLFQSFIQKREELRQKHYRAIVICKSGVAVSRLLYKNLTQLFPTIEFVQSMSLKEFEQLSADDLAIDLIFSTIYVSTDKKLFIIKQLLNKTDKEVLQRNVYQFIGGYDQPIIDIAEVLDLISNNAVVKDYRLLEKELSAYLLSNAPTKVTTNRLRLTDILTLEDVKFSSRAFTFTEAIYALGEPLLRKGTIERGYLNTIITQYNPDYPYFIIAPKIAIPHAAPTDGVNQLSMSLLRVTHGVPFSTELEAELLLLIAPKDNKSHQEALLNFYEFVNEPDQRQLLLACRSEKELYQVLKQIG